MLEAATIYAGDGKDEAKDWAGKNVSKRYRNQKKGETCSYGTREECVSCVICRTSELVGTGKDLNLLKHGLEIPNIDSSGTYDCGT